MHIINRVVSASAVIKNLLPSREEDFYEWRFGNVFYTKSGRVNRFY